MKNILRKIFNLSDITYAWLLIVSMLTFIFSLYNEKFNPDTTPLIQWITYGSAILSAILWSILNYISHININSNYRKYNDIDSYVNNLVISKDEKLELKSYLNDFVSDLISQGKNKEEAITIAINQFKVKEFYSLSKNNPILNLPIHYYLIGYILVDIAIVVILLVLTNTILINSFLILSIEFMLVSYGIGFLGLFIIYRILDTIISKKLQD